MYYIKLFLFLWSSIKGAKVGLATTFSANNDPWNPDPGLACLHGRKLNDSKDLGVAHPTLPCLSKVFIYNIRNGRSVVAQVYDRGPKSAALDLTIKTAKSIKSNGYEQVIYIPLKK